jgi:uncharacterized protein YcfJ
MNKQLLMGVGIGIAVAAVIGAVANYSGNAPAVTARSVAAQPLMATTAPVSTIHNSDTSPHFAEVLASSPVLVSDRVAREECKDVQVRRQKPVKDENKIAGTAIGAVVGGVLGNQIGDGTGRTIAKVAGAVAGGYAGRKVQDHLQKTHMETVNDRQCHTVYDTHKKPDGYSVKYELDGKVRTVHMKTDPGVGARIPANDKRLSAS